MMTAELTPNTVRLLMRNMPMLRGVQAKFEFTMIVSLELKYRLYASVSGPIVKLYE